MTDRLIIADASRVSVADFARALGLRVRTKEQKEADWRANCERYADFIEAGNEYGVPPPYLRDARQIVEQRALTRKVEGELRFTVEQQRRSAA